MRSMNTLEPNKISAIASSTAQANLGHEQVERALTESALNSEGEDAVRITLIVAPGTLDRVDGQTLVRTIARIKQELLRAGEERQAVFSYSTEAELANTGTEH